MYLKFGSCKLRFCTLRFKSGLAFFFLIRPYLIVFWVLFVSILFVFLLKLIVITSVAVSKIFLNYPKLLLCVLFCV